MNQKQDDYQVVQDIVGRYINAFNNRDIKGLLEVSQLTRPQQDHYSKLFDVYQSLSIKVVPNSFTLRKYEGIASAKFAITKLIDMNGNTAVTSASWTRMGIKIAKKNGSWQKAEITLSN